MIVAGIFGLVLLLADDGGSVLAPEAACQMVAKEEVPPGEYTIAGTYFSDGHHGALLEIRGCRESILNPTFADDVAARMADYRQAVDAKCGGHLMNDYLVGTFTGHFVVIPMYLPGADGPSSVKTFAVNRIETKDLDAGRDVCPKN